MAGFNPFSFFQTPQAAPQLPSVSDIANQALTGWQTQANAIPQFNNAAASINTGYQNSLAGILPGYQGALATSVGNANSLLGGNIPADVQAAVRRSGALSSLNGGFGTSSGMAGNLTARDFGLTSLNLMNQGQNMLGQDIGLGRSISPANGGQFLSTPQSFMGLAEQTAQGNNAINYSNSLQVSPFQSLFNNLPNLAVQGGLSYLTGGLGSSSPLGSFLNGLGGTSSSQQSFQGTYNPSSSIFNPSNNYNPQLFPQQ